MSRAVSWFRASRLRSTEASFVTGLSTRVSAGDLSLEEPPVLEHALRGLLAKAKKEGLIPAQGSGSGLVVPLGHVRYAGCGPGEVRVESDDRGTHTAKLGRMDPCRIQILKESEWN